MIKALKIIVIAIITVVIVCTCITIMFYNQDVKLLKSTEFRISNPVDEIKATVIMTNRDMPIKVNKGTTATKVEYIEGENRFILYYQLTDVKKGDLTEKEVDSIVQSLKAIKLERTISNPDNKTFVEHRVTFVYIYKDINDEVIYSFQIDPKEYLKK